MDEDNNNYLEFEYKKLPLQIRPIVTLDQLSKRRESTLHYEQQVFEYE